MINLDKNSSSNELLPNFTTYGQITKNVDGEKNENIVRSKSKVKKDDIVSLECSDSDAEIDPHYIYTDNPLYTSKEDFVNQSLPKDTFSLDKTPQPNDQGSLFQTITGVQNLQPYSNTNTTGKKMGRRYSIDSMLVMNRIENRYRKIHEIDRSILKRKLFPV